MKNLSFRKIKNNTVLTKNKVWCLLSTFICSGWVSMIVRYVPSSPETRGSLTYVGRSASIKFDPPSVPYVPSLYSVV